MNMIYKDDTLYIDLVGNIGVGEVSILRNRLFTVLDQYEVENVVINVKDAFSLNKIGMNKLVKEYHQKYKGNLIIDTK